MKQTNHLHVVPRLKTVGTTPPLLHTPSYCVHKSCTYLPFSQPYFLHFFLYFSFFFFYALCLLVFIRFPPGLLYFFLYIYFFCLHQYFCVTKYCRRMVTLCTSAMGLFCCSHSNSCHHPSSALRRPLPTFFFLCSFLQFLPSSHKPACDIIHSFHGQVFKLLQPYCTGSVRTSISFAALSNGPVTPTKE